MICPPHLEPMDVVGFDFEGVRLVTSSSSTETRRVVATYAVDRQDGVEVAGEVEMENRSAVRRRIRYRQSIPIPEDRRPWIDEASPLCYEADRSSIVLVIESTLEAGETATHPVDWSVVLGIAADIDRDGKVGGSDRGLLLADWQTNAERSDLNRAGVVDGKDLGVLLEYWSP